ncbi:MAG TPA: hypothetical protein VHM26_17980, partial [Chitinophagaceae bacterium]|nr:hypothetical protein [Chitinophagaceae bacterium]
KKITDHTETYEAGKITYCLKEILRAKPPRRLIVLYNDNEPLHHLHIDFYRKAYHRSTTIETMNETTFIKKTDTLIYSNGDYNDSLRRFFRVDTLSTCKYGVMVVVN